MMDITSLAKPGAKNVVATPRQSRQPHHRPKPIADLDFNLYSGLYRAQLIIKDKLHITEPILADKIGSGGVFVTFPEVSAESATVKVQTHVKTRTRAPGSLSRAPHYWMRMARR